MPTFDYADQFPRVGGTSEKLQCVTCGHRGYPWPEYPEGAPTIAQWWANSCLRGHAPCPRCGKQLVVLRNGHPRTHPRCPSTTAALKAT